MSNPQPGRPGSFCCSTLLLATVPDIPWHWRPALIVTQLHCNTRVIRFEGVTYYLLTQPSGTTCTQWQQQFSLLTGTVFTQG